MSDTSEDWGTENWKCVCVLGDCHYCESKIQNAKVTLTEYGVEDEQSNI